MPNSSICGSPVSITSIAECTTAGSTQPPLTEPDNSPLSLTASFAPGLRGAEPYIVTTVATATRSPRSRHRSTSGNISRIEFLPSFDTQFFPTAQAPILKRLRKAIESPIIIHHAVTYAPLLLSRRGEGGEEWLGGPLWSP